MRKSTLKKKLTGMNKNKNNNHNKTKKKTYSKEDYASGDGFLTTVWGPMMWSYLHTMSFNYPVHPTDEDKKHYRDFMISLQYVLPCKYCRMNLANNFKKNPIKPCHMANRDAFSRYVYDLHETVNKMLKKKVHLTYCEVRDRYENFRARCTQEKPTIFSFKQMQEDPAQKTNNKNKTTKNNKEKGCTVPLYGKKSKCIIKIVPQEEKQETFQMDKKCIKSKTPDHLSN
jgi:hypothetical protein